LNPDVTVSEVTVRIAHWLRTYWLAPALLAAAGLLELTGWREAALVFAGSALTKALDLHKDQRQEHRQALAEQCRGLDETRRLLYMIRISDVPPPDLVATAANALVHHHGQALSDKELLLSDRDLLFQLLVCGQRGRSEQNEWLEHQISELTAMRDAVLRRA
jgi:hypothetical protein